MDPKWMLLVGKGAVWYIFYWEC